MANTSAGQLEAPVIELVEMANTSAVLGELVLGEGVLGSTGLDSPGLAAPVIYLSEGGAVAPRLSAPTIYLSTESGEDTGGGGNTGSDEPSVITGKILAHGQITLYAMFDAPEIHRYYQLALSTASAPAKPTTFPPVAPWTIVEPSYTEGSTNNLYTVECAVYADGTFSYTEVSLSSSYEAAKAAYNKAVSANTTASEAKAAADAATTVTSTLNTKVTTLTGRVESTETMAKQNAANIELRAKASEVEAAIDNIQVGARNLIRNSGTLIYKDYYFGDEPVDFNTTLDAPTIYLTTTGQLDAPEITIEEE